MCLKSFLVSGCSSEFQLIPFANNDLVLTKFMKVKSGNWLDWFMNKVGAAGMTMENAVAIRSDAYEKNMKPWIEEKRRTKFVVHEQKHHEQCLRTNWFPFHSMKYVMIWLGIYLFQWSKHPYFDHLYEREARQSAEQKDPYPWKEEGFSRWLPFRISK